mgnify:CR=1 FL=1
MQMNNLKQTISILNIIDNCLKHSYLATKTKGIITIHVANQK